MCSKECFHFTNLDRFSSIKQYGLVPRLEENSKAVKDIKPKVSFSDGKYAAAGLMADFYQVYCSIKNGTRDKSKTDPDLEKKVLSSNSFEEFLGDGMYLMFDGSEIKKFQQDHLEIAEKFSKHAFSEEIISMEEFQEIMKVRDDKKISIEDTVRNAITQGVATEDIKKVESLERTNDKNISEVSKDD